MNFRIAILTVLLIPFMFLIAGQTEANSEKEENSPGQTKGIPALPSEEAKKEATQPAPAAPQGPQTQDNKAQDTEDLSAKQQPSGHVKPPRDRRWIVKETKPAPAKPGAVKTQPLRWEGETQKLRCEAYLAQIRASFRRARYFSIKGDSCSCAEHSKRFMDTAETCRQDCPEGYLAASGVSDRIFRNIEWLKELGTRRCLGLSSSKMGKVSKGANPKTTDSAEEPPDPIH